MRRQPHCPLTCPPSLLSHARKNSMATIWTCLCESLISTKLFKKMLPRQFPAQHLAHLCLKSAGEKQSFLGQALT